MGSIYYLLLNYVQIESIICDAISNIDISFCDKDDTIDSCLKFEWEGNKLKLQYFSFINCDIDYLDLLNKGKEDLASLIKELKERNIHFTYYNLGETSIKAYLIEVLSKWKRTSKFMKLPFVNIKFTGSDNENLTCLITASKQNNVDADIERKILETKLEFADNLNDLEVKNIIPKEIY